jgi:hypothetical protein
MHLKNVEKLLSVSISYYIKIFVGVKKFQGCFVLLFVKSVTFMMQRLVQVIYEVHVFDKALSNRYTFHLRE